ncbi:tRNA epoxyqueuosine(34) reductase QueG [Thorsellia kenyensis]|uniref:Epoxyqueuosine reductase n=1 Tax=Thorsellia kenyensis TaxID=1549888 RepID=A0ABV6CAU0_9GAMM
MDNCRNNSPLSTEKITLIKATIRELSLELGFSQVGFCDLDVKNEHKRLKQWLDNHYHGSMEWMHNHLELRENPNLLLEGALSAIVVRLDYLPADAKFAQVLSQPELGYISRYALGRDYHKVMRKKLAQLVEKLKEILPLWFKKLSLSYRPFVDSAPILERPLAAKAGLGWVGKHSLLINKEAGSWFFIGEILINMPLYLQESPATIESLCGTCQACRTICPTQAIVDDYIVDARRCISYLTIENKGAIPLEFRPLMGNRIYGCDDCQLICPHNRLAPLGQLEALIANKKLKAPTLLSLFSWDEMTFLKETEGSPIRRIGYAAWLRNIATALGNIPFDENQSPLFINALNEKKGLSELVDEHIDWAISRHRGQAILVTQQQKRLVRSIKKGLPRDA